MCPFQSGAFGRAAKKKKQTQNAFVMLGVGTALMLWFAEKREAVCNTCDRFAFPEPGCRARWH